MTQPIISREKARTLSLPRFFTGIPCLHGHICERYTSGKGCVECVRLKSVEAQDRNGLRYRTRSKPKKQLAERQRPKTGSDFIKPITAARLMAGRA